MPLAAITGASSGIGKGYAEALAKQGYDLVLIARRSNILEGLKAQYEAAHQIKVTTITADLSKSSDTHALARALSALPLDLLINNAGAGNDGDFLKKSAEDVASLTYLLIDSLVYLTNVIGTSMVKRGGGTIANIGSAVSFWPTTPSYALYGSAKRFVASFSESIDLENKRLQNKVRVLTVNPGLIGTEFAARASGDKTTVDPQPIAKATTTDAFVGKTLPQILSGRKRVINYGALIFESRLLNTYLFPRKLSTYLFNRAVTKLVK